MTTIDCDLLFIYGSLMRDAQGRYNPMLKSVADYIGDTYYRGKLFQIGSYPGVIPSSQSADKVTGELYRLHKPVATLALLDDYEGCSPMHEQPYEYLRRIISVAAKDGSTTSAWAYLYNRPTEGLPQITSGNYRHRRKA